MRNGVLPAILVLGVAALVSTGFIQPAAAQSLRDLDTNATPALSPDAIRVVQRALRTRDTNPGSPDGIVGPKTVEAIRQFQERYGMRASGTIDNQLLFALGHADLVGGPNR